MSRYGGNHDTEAMLGAAAIWKARAFVDDRSVFTDNKIWTIDAIEALRTHFSQNPDRGEGTFLLKLQRQLEPAPDVAKRLAAEMIWLLLLCPSNLSAGKKRQNVSETWSWTGEALPESAAPYLTDHVLEGVGSAGTAFSTERWRELVFLINLSMAFKSLRPSERQALADDPWRFSGWLDDIPNSGTRQFRHMILYLLFPDTFESIFALGDRRTIAAAFSGSHMKTIRSLKPSELDSALSKVRQALEARHDNKPIHFYLPPIYEEWKQPGFSAQTESITREHIIQALSEIDHNGVPDRAESVGYDLLYEAKRYPPKLVLAIAARYSNGAELDRNEFTGGDDSPAFKLLRSFGFEILPKDALRLLLQRFFIQAKEARSLTVAGYPTEYRDLHVKVSFGKGVQARIPWIGFLGPGQTPTRGSYPVILYYREAGRLLVAYGVSETDNPGLKWRGLEEKQTIDEYFFKHLARSPERYGESRIDSVFPISEDIPISEVIESIERVIDVYRTLFQTGTGLTQEAPISELTLEDEPYTLDDAIEGLFIERERFGSIVERFRAKKNVILQGPPGVGKTFVAKRIARTLIGSKDPKRLGFIQFHQSYSYEDFVQGYRPNSVGGFARRDGIFFEFCQRALAAPDLEHVFIIDEINRGNLSKVFGELLMLIEADKRSQDWAMPLTYKHDNDLPFYVPDNVYLLGLMNTADRSLAMVDYALRRRFAFIDLLPGFHTSQFSDFLKNAGAPDTLISRTIHVFTALNSEIKDDRSNLGPGFQIGHSYFCNVPSGMRAGEDWYQQVVETEILPLLEEYWFDNPEKVADWTARLKG